MTGLSQQDSTKSLAMEQQSWTAQIQLSLQGVAERARTQPDDEPADSEEGWQLIERALLLGAEVLKTMPHVTR